MSAQDALAAALERRRTSATEPNLIDAAAQLEAIPLEEVLRVLDGLGNGIGWASPARTQAAVRQAAGIIRAGSIERATESLSAALAGVPGSRRTDPPTSHAAASEVRVTATNQAGRLLQQYRVHDEHLGFHVRTRTVCGRPAGLTSEEAADAAPEVSLRSEFSKRCSDLQAAGLLEVVLHDVEEDGSGADAHDPDRQTVVAVPLTRPGRSGRQRQVLAITDAGRALARELAAGA